MKRWHLFLIIPLMVFAFWGTTLIMRGSPSEKTATPAQQSAEQLTVYTTGQATSPQMHFWLAHAKWRPAFHAGGQVLEEPHGSGRPASRRQG